MKHEMWFKQNKQGKTVVTCTCGWSGYHKRQKIQEQKAKKHQEKYDAEWANAVHGF